MNPVVTRSECSFFNPRAADGAIPQNQNTQFQFASSTCVFTASTSTPTTTIQTVRIATTTGATSTDFAIVPYFTGGEIVLISLVILAFFANITMWIIQSFRVVTTKKKYLQYNGGDVEVRDDL